jgi:hypothetical protein
MKTLLRSAGLALLAMVVLAPNANAQFEKCQRTIAKANSQYLQARVKALAKCNEGVVKGSVVSCPDSKALAALDKAKTKLTASIDKSCGGDDKVCNLETNALDTTEPTAQQLGWPSQCPNFEKGECRNSVRFCTGIVDCLTCIGDAAVDQEITLLYGSLDLPSTSDKTKNKCQVTIGKATTAFLNSSSKALQKCWDAKINGKFTTGDCFNPSAGDGKYAAAIEKASTKMKTSICKACGGADKTCDGTGDIDPTTIGFPTECSRVAEPHGGADCFGTITDLNSLVTCVDCVTRFKANCVDNLQVPQLTPFPAECNSCTLPPETGACPSAITFTADGQKVDLDTGFTGLAHDAKVPTNGRITLTVSGCDGVAQPTCGECDVNGPIENPGGPEFDTHRCKDASWVRCSSDSDCTNATQCVGGSNNGGLCTTPGDCPNACSGGSNDGNACTVNTECPGGSCSIGSCVNAGVTGPCIYFFGAPLPLRAGGVSTCVVNEISGPVTGTINFNDGTSINNVPLASKVFPVGGEFNPCPHCIAGACDAGPRNSQACIVNGDSQFGPVSLDCPPNPGSVAGTLGIDLHISTGDQVKTVTTANPRCTATGFSGLRCLCDTCSSPGQEGCSTNADCSAIAVQCLGGTNSGAACSDDSECPGGGFCSGGAGICGGRRCQGGTEAGKPCSACIGGTNHGATCSVQSQCPSGACSLGCAGGGSCGRPGEATKPNVCQDDPDTADLDCVDGGDNEGFCRLGPGEAFCSTQTFHSCSTDVDCSPTGPCGADCLPDQVCLFKQRPCFTDNGKIGNTVKVSGNADTVCGGIAKPTVGTFFCVAPVSASAVNAAGGLPALGRVRIPGIVGLIP